VPPSRTGPWANPVANAGNCARCLWILCGPWHVDRWGTYPQWCSVDAAWGPR